MKKIIYVGVFGLSLLCSAAQPQEASALKLESSKIKFSMLKTSESNKQKMDRLNSSFESQRKKIAAKSQAAKKAKEETQAIASSRQELEKNIEALKAEIAELDDMFVRISGYAADAAGNAYAAGNCTEYVKTMRPDIGNFWGNANNWYAAAQSNGFKVGDKPKIGAIAQTTEGWAGHVAYVEKISRDRMYVTISEMNYGALYQMNTRTVAASSFKYIYEKP